MSFLLLPLEFKKQKNLNKKYPVAENKISMKYCKTLIAQ